MWVGRFTGGGEGEGDNGGDGVEGLMESGEGERGRETDVDGVG